MLEIKIKEEIVDINMQGNMLDLGAEMAVLGNTVAKNDERLVQGLLLGISEIIPQEKLIECINKIYDVQKIIKFINK